LNSSPKPLPSKGEVARALSNLDAYLDTWTDVDGGVHGYIIHHHRDYAVVTAPACWTQGLRILGHLSLHRKTGEERWLDRAEKESIYLASLYEREVHLYHDSTTPLTLINNAWPTLALFKSAQVLREARGGSEELEQVAMDNLRERIIREHWDNDANTFYFCPVGFHGERVHTHNQTAITISALTAAAELEGDRNIVDRYAIPAANHLVVNQNKSGELEGGWGYNDAGSSHLYYYLYTALNTRGLLDLYEYTSDSRYLDSAALAGHHLMSMIDPGTKLFSHRYVSGKGKTKRYPYPTMIAASGLGLLQIRRLRRHGIELDPGESISELMKWQAQTGGFANFIGSTDIWTPDLYPCEPDKRKWRDVVCVPFWNVFTYELLVDMLDEGTEIPPPAVRFPYLEETDDGYEFQEDEDRVTLSVSGRTVSYFDKKRDYMLFSTERMRGVPFGAYPNCEIATIDKLKRRLKLLLVAGAAASAAVLILLVLLLL